MAVIRYSKTDAGRQEIEQRTRRLPSALRSILLMVDGQRDADELASLIESLRAPADTLQQLMDLGLIEANEQAVAVQAAAVGGTAPAAAQAENVEASAEVAANTERFQALYAMTSESIRSHLGLKGYFLQLKVERCSTVAELEALLPDVAEALGKAKSDALARRWLSEARELALGSATA